MSTIHRPHGGADEGIPGDRAGPAAGQSLGGFEERLLAELKQAVAQHAAATHPQPRRCAGRAWPVRPLLLTGAASAALAAGLAVAVTVASGGGTGRPPSGPTPAFAPATTAPAVLHNAVLAALAEPAMTPRTGQFVYSKVYLTNANWPGPEVNQTWLPVSGTRFGLASQTLTLTGGRHATWTHPVPVCVNGGQKFPPGYTPDLTKVSRFRPSCTPADSAGYRPGMPTRPAALRTWLYKTNHDIQPGRAGAINLLWVVGAMLTNDYLTPAQRAAAYQVLSQIPGLRVVPKTADVLGRAGVGVRWRLGTSHNPVSTYTLIFDRHTYQPLGMNWTGTLGLGGARGGLALVKLAIVNTAGQLP